jgi:hypothetical protein
MRLVRRLSRLPARRQTLAVLALLAHVLAATGAPVPSLRRPFPGQSSGAYPCSDHTCGCLTAEQCWAGDCCCYTLEQKLAWADARGVAPPNHVRREVEARKTRGRTKVARSCCSSECDNGDSRGAETCCEKSTEPAASKQQSIVVRWVVGSYVQKCRGKTPAGLLELEPAVSPPLNSDRPSPSKSERYVPASAPLPVSTLEPPPAPPPRRL